MSDLMQAFYPCTIDAATVQLDLRRSLCVQHMAGRCQITATNGDRETKLLLSAEAAYELAGLLVYAVQSRVIPCLGNTVRHNTI